MSGKPPNGAPPPPAPDEIIEQNLMALAQFCCLKAAILLYPKPDGTVGIISANSSHKATLQALKVAQAKVLAGMEPDPGPQIILPN